MHSMPLKLTTLLAAAVFLAGCAGHAKKAVSAVPEPGSTAAEFPDIDDLQRQVREAVEMVDKIDQPINETDAQRRKRLGLRPKDGQ